MTALSSLPHRFRPYIAPVLILIALTALQSLVNPQVFQPYFGAISPLLAIVGVLALAAILFAVGKFPVYHPERRGLRWALGFGSLFGVIVIFLDRLILFPRDMNVPFPQSLLFYPVVGFVVETLFHVLPFTLLMRLPRPLRFPMWLNIFIVALIEPAYQMASFGRAYPPWAVLATGAHIFLINVVQLSLFTRYDFVSMYGMRLTYYLFWGTLRLSLLF